MVVLICVRSASQCSKCGCVLVQWLSAGVNVGAVTEGVGMRADVVVHIGVRLPFCVVVESAGVCVSAVARNTGQCSSGQYALVQEFVQDISSMEVIVVWRREGCKIAKRDIFHGGIHCQK